MKAVNKLELPDDFDEKLRLKLINIRDAGDLNTSYRLMQELTTEVRRLTHQAFKLGQK